MMDFNMENSHGCPCDGCTEETGRHPGCHDHCEDRYKPWRKKLDEKNEAKRKYEESNYTMSDDKKRALWRSKRYSRQLTYNKSTKAD